MQSLLRLRHPAVCIIDVAGFAVALGLVIIFRPSFITAVLPLAIALQYLVSLVHHAMPFTALRSKLDRGVIFLVIGATYVPYWGNLLPAPEAWARLPWVGVCVVVGLCLVYFGAPEKVNGVFYALFASAGLVISFYELQQWLPPAGLAAFWLGTALYAASQVAYEARRPDPLPKLFGYRGVQHLLLFAATTIGSVVAILYT
ncbi:MAG: hemolysin III family protein [Patescibacteria group bacterium]